LIIWLIKVDRSNQTGDKLNGMPDNKSEGEQIMLLSHVHDQVEMSKIKSK